MYCVYCSARKLHFISTHLDRATVSLNVTLTNHRRSLRSLRHRQVQPVAEDLVVTGPKSTEVKWQGPKVVAEIQQQQQGQSQAKRQPFQREPLKKVPVTLEGITTENQYSKLADIVTPLWKMSYGEQLKLKYQQTQNVCEAFFARLRESRSKAKKHKSHPFGLEAVRPSPVHEQYRNKDEFSIQKSVDGDPKTVGFFIGRPSHEGVVCVPADELVIIKDLHKTVARSFEEYIQMSPLLACHRFNEGGFWRNVRVRSNLAGDLMAIVIVHPQQMTQDEILQEQVKIRDYFFSGPGSICGLKSLYFQTCIHTKCTHEISPYKLLGGDSHIYETIFDLSLRISPDSFFQVNTLAAKVLFETVREVSEIDNTCSVLDLCCGTGVIGLVMARDVKQVLGIDVVAHSIKDAVFNAKNNGIKNATFWCGRIEDLILDAVSSHLAGDCIVAVVNPPGSGLGKGAVSTIRRTKRIHQLIYISCNAEQAIDDFLRLCRPSNGNSLGKPFALRRAIPVDLFPHTYHCEVILVFERQS